MSVMPRKRRVFAHRGKIIGVSRYQKTYLRAPVRPKAGQSRQVETGLLAPVAMAVPQSLVYLRGAPATLVSALMV